MEAPQPERPMTPADLPAGALHTLQHSLGVDQHGQGEQYRNHFVTDETSPDGQLCAALTAAGLMRKREPRPSIYSGMDLWHVTDAGKTFVAEHSPPPPKLSRAAQRYRRYMDADSSLSFGEWLRTPWANLANPA